ncbi:AMP-dependent synthetase and ligase (plasmid) [Haloterrigena turkmenica DSM 5511]|uniref:AMP-dependent synthetase and ligase n=1 Tax=Haloterrigena turkmenica (strain ATCC 51198 / DSM 5511 / JCM 9101 / NCIMB 13204 / VKM B-1734 / 4k) TaxID=543526 RepID=D2RZV6_HALTV|nr:AMP-binding protein [Haloterrigena turkmenica]ADB62653.1 AMP-dependent synthetase and ligase [Haloterrigena turkmenica DSM 5511]
MPTTLTSMEYNFDLGIEDQGSFVDRSRAFNVGDLLRKAARTNSDRVAVSEPSVTRTYAELDDRVNRLSNALLERGYRPNETTIGIISENRSEVVEVMYAGAKLGCLVPALNWRLEREELLHCIDLVEPDVLFVSERFADRRSWVEDGAESDPEFVFFDGTDDAGYESVLEERDASEPLPDQRIDPEQGLVVLYTSGTTGLPKGVVISHRTWIARAFKTITDFGLEKGDSQLAWPPMFHIVSADWIPTVTILGGTYYPVDGFDNEAVVDVLRENGSPIGWLVLLPGVIQRFLEYMDENDVSVDEFRECRNVGALVDLIDPKKVERVTERFDQPYKNSYGATENGNVLSGGNDIPIGVRPTDDELAKEESAYTDCKLIDEDWNEVGVGEKGELATRGPSLCSGYIENPEANEDEFDDGWFRTGDIFIKNEDGTYSFVNRRKYLIKSGGENIYPAEIETTLLTHEKIDDAVVVRVPDEKWGEVPRAVVGTEDPSAVSEDELMTLLRDEIASYKLPHYVDIVRPEDFPRSTTGKIVREEIEDWDVSSEERVREV